MGYNNPFAMFSGPIKNYVFKRVAPYIDVFFSMEGSTDEKIDGAAKYVETEVKNKLEDFKTKLKENMTHEENV